MNDLASALEPYRRFDPAGWVALHQVMPVWLGLLAVALGATMLLIGGGRLFRLLAAPLGASVALLWTGVVAGKLGLQAQAQQLTIIASVVLSGLGLLFPPGALFFLFGVPAGLVAGELAGSADWLLGFLPGFLVGGAVAMAAHRSIGAVASALAGAWVLTLGLLACLAPLGSAVPRVAGQPWVVIAAAALFALGGAVYQLFVRLPPEERTRRTQEKRQAKLRLKEQQSP